MISRTPGLLDRSTEDNLVLLLREWILSPTATDSGGIRTLISHSDMRNSDMPERTSFSAFARPLACGPDANTPVVAFPLILSTNSSIEPESRFSQALICKRRNVIHLCPAGMTVR